MVGAVAIYLLGWWKRESLFVFIATGLALWPGIRKHVWDVVLMRGTDKQRGLLLLTGGMLLLFRMLRRW
jgi:hypothetical protein